MTLDAGTEQHASQAGGSGARADSSSCGNGSVDKPEQTAVIFMCLGVVQVGEDPSSGMVSARARVDGTWANSYYTASGAGVYAPPQTECPGPVPADWLQPHPAPPMAFASAAQQPPRAGALQVCYGKAVADRLRLLPPLQRGPSSAARQPPSAGAPQGCYEKALADQPQLLPSQLRAPTSAARRSESPGALHHQQPAAHAAQHFPALQQGQERLLFEAA